MTRTAASIVPLDVDSLLNAVQRAVIVTDLQGTVHLWNAYAESLYGWTAGEVLGRNIADVVVPESAAEHAQAIMAQLSAGQTWTGEFSVQRRDGTIFLAEVVDSPLHSANGELVGIIGVSQDVTERAVRRQHLRQSEQLLQRALVAGGMFAYSWDPQTDLVDRSESVRLVLGSGAPVTETRAQSLSHVHQDDRERMHEMVNGLAPGHPTFNATYRYLREDGSTVILEESGAGEFDADGRLIRVRGLTADVTERREVEQALSTAAAQLSAIFENAPLGLGFWDRQLRFTRLNAALAEINGLPIEAHLGKTPAELLPNIEGIGAIMAQWQEIMERGEPLTAVEISGETPAQPGQLRWWRENFFPVRIGQETVGLAAIVEEITAQKLADAERRHLSELLAQTHEPIFIWEVDGGITSWNKGAEALYGFSTAEAMGTSPHQLLRTVHPISRNEVRAALERAGAWQGEVTHHTRDGREITVESHQHLALLDGRRLVMESARDITERKRLERIQAEFIALAAHELKTPLTSIKGFAQLLRRGVPSESALDTIVNQVNRLDRLVGDLLDVSRLDTGRLELRRRAINLVVLARQQVEESQAATDRHTLRLKVPDTPMYGSWDEDRIIQIFQNLLSNAIKYSPEGGTVEVCLERQGSLARISVTDDGMGVSEAELPRIFERFHRLESAKDAAGGMGLGLSITRALVEAHGGRIWAESPGAGQGTTFWFTLPLEDGRPTADD